MPAIIRVWIDLDVEDEGSELVTEIPADFGPSATFVAVDDSQLARAHAIELAAAFAMRLHAAAERAQARAEGEERTAASSALVN